MKLISLEQGVESSIPSNGDFPLRDCFLVLLDQFDEFWFNFLPDFVTGRISRGQIAPKMESHFVLSAAVAD